MARSTRCAVSVVSVLGAIAAGGCGQEAPPLLPSALITVDTDADVSTSSGLHLRIDIFAEDGTWIESRDYPRSRPEDWPASFGVVSPDESRAYDVLVRLRVYPEGSVRDYLGERYEPSSAFEPPKFATTLDELCANAEELPPNVSRVFRRGPNPVSGLKTGCGYQSTSGSVAAHVTIHEPGRYRFQVTHTTPDHAAAWPLVLRPDCKSTEGEVCSEYVGVPGTLYLHKVETDLMPGGYTIVTRDSRETREPGDGVLRWTRADQWGPDEVPASIPRESSLKATTADLAPRLLDRKDGHDITPETEPHPFSTIDRLVRVHLVPAQQTNVQVKLSLGCAAKMAKLAILPNGTVDAAQSGSCDDNALSTTFPPSVEAESFSAQSETCSETDSTDSVVCVPGGAFTFGGTTQNGSGLDRESSTLPMRMAGVTRFFMDRYEFTVRRYEQALAAGFRREGDHVDTYSDPLAWSPNPLPTVTAAYPINGMSYRFGKRLCAFFGGDLPTEVQWEYAVSRAGRAEKVSFPWGNDKPSCLYGVFRNDSNFECSRKTNYPYPQAVDGSANAADVNPLGIVGLAGNVAEWVRDGFELYDSACWRGATSINPECVDPSAPRRSVRGSSFYGPPASAAAEKRESSFIGYEVGLRCVYESMPTRTWTGR